MLVLAINTSIPPVGVALAYRNKLLGEIQLAIMNTYSQYLLPTIDFLLAQCQIERKQIEGLAVTVGPGFFTGLRVGLATIQGLALGLGLKIATLSTLRLLVESCRVMYQGQVWVIIDARRGLVYAAPFLIIDGRVKRLEQDTAMQPNHLAKFLKPPAFLLGTGARIYATEFLRSGLTLAPAWIDSPRSGYLALLGVEILSAGYGIDPEELKPCYCRPSDAEIEFGLPLDEYQFFK